MRKRLVESNTHSPIPALQQLTFRRYSFPNSPRNHKRNVNMTAEQSPSCAGCLHKTVPRGKRDLRSIYSKNHDCQITALGKINRKSRNGGR
ncbi:hypothetical protein CDAR_586141 [Caerostris darwini]|uniref:Uncharacterized protein n=1 Tax=Caerostris darwini TaxID=1538125 RepID=A0AAV4UWU4_9ARAC|nr:hypothetical protein CDAR_586141 [Caerostris darwini]